MCAAWQVLQSFQLGTMQVDHIIVVGAPTRRTSQLLDVLGFSLQGHFGVHHVYSKDSHPFVLEAPQHGALQSYDDAQVFLFMWGSM